MNEHVADLRRRLPWLGLATLIPLAAVFWYILSNRGAGVVPPSVTPQEQQGDINAQTHQFCGACHAYPPADSFPREAWKGEVEQGYMFFAQSKLALQAPPIEAVVSYYEQRSPNTLAAPLIERAATALPVAFARANYAVWPQAKAPAVSNVNLVHLSDAKLPEVLACEMRAGAVLAIKPSDAKPAWRVLGNVANPAHAEVVDLDGDGIKDVLVADLGNFAPTDRSCGSIIWLRGRPDGSFVKIPLLENIGRVADVQAADFRGVGKLDLVVAEFGWRTTGALHYLENQTTDWSQPKFAARILDDRHGAIHVPVGDINGDGKLDFVALIGQEHETVVGFINVGGGNFRKETLYTAPHPAWGSSGIQLVDLNGDGKLDVLYTNGDTLDQPYLLKPYHGIAWLENCGTLPFTHHEIAPMFGVHRAVAADFSGTGRLDIAAVCFLPAGGFPHRKSRQLDAVIYLEQTSPGKFSRHTLEAGACDYVSCAAGDVFGTGKIDLVIGNYSLAPAEFGLTIWRNQGKR